jgi:hypothetical protein
MNFQFDKVMLSTIYEKMNNQKSNNEYIIYALLTITL